MTSRIPVKNALVLVLMGLLLAQLPGCAGIGSSSGGSKTGGGGAGTTAQAPAQPSGLQATAGNAQVSLIWNAGAGATSYHVKRATTSGGPYTQVAAPAMPNFADAGLTNGTTYFYVVSAVNAGSA